MKYISTRSSAAAVSFRDTVLSSMASGGGLYLPENWSVITPHELEIMKGKPFAAIAGRILAPFVLDQDLNDQDLALILNDCFGPQADIFTDPQIAPLTAIGKDDYLLELFHGPTLAFKDIALTFLARLFDHYTCNDKRPLTIIGATSGDTGSAAIHACAKIKNAHIFILHPANRISEIQRRQMTTHPSTYVHNIALNGTFDDCQTLVKTLLEDSGFQSSLRLTAINSVNWARIAMQAVYYFTAALALPADSKPPTFVVPTGNFGNIFAGYVARKMGLPMGQLVVASNRNDILYRFFQTGEMAVDRVVPSNSPSMDIQISSNFERFLFDLVGRDPRIVNQLMNKFKDRGHFQLTRDDHLKAQQIFAAGRCDDDQTIDQIKKTYQETGLLVDPHTAVGLHVAREYRNKNPLTGPIISLACAHPAKFPETLKKAIKIHPELPENLKNLKNLPERVVPITNNIDIVKNYIRGIVGI